MVKKNNHKSQDKVLSFSRREQQIMSIIYERKEASVQDVLERLPNPPGYSAVRAMLSKLEKKGHIQHIEIGQKFLYSATLDKNTAQSSALAKLVKTFFGGSKIDAATALLGINTNNIDQDDIQALEQLVKQAKQQQRQK